jgi:ribosome maturation factor RimP
MSSRDPLHQRLVAIVEPVCVAAGYDLVDLRLKSEQGGWVLRVFIDVHTSDVESAAGASLDPDWWKHGVDLADCEKLSRELSAVLDVEDPIPHAYSLEISSPGIDRPLRTPAHYRRFQGAEVKIALAVPLAGTDRKNFKGELTSVTEDGAHVVVTVDGQPFQLPLADIDTAKLVPDWDDVMKGGSGVGRHDTMPKSKKAAHR